MIGISKRVIQLLVFFFFVYGCGDFSVGQYTYIPPERLNDGLNIGTLAEASIDSTLIKKAVNRIAGGKYGEVHSLLIYKNNKLVLEEYFKGHDYQWDAPHHHGSLVEWDKDSLHYVHSVSKSITSLCVGIAVDKGFIKDVKQSIFDYLPGYEYLNTGDKKYINIEHLLTCTSGLQWAEWNAPLSSMENDQVAIWFHEKGPVDFFLQRPFVAVPGTLFNYCGGGIETLGVIIENATGMSLQEFSAKYLFEPMGIKKAKWQIIYPTGEVHAAAGLKLMPRDMIKIGVMMMNKGVWDGKRIVSEEWVEKSEFPWQANQGIKVPGEDLGRMGYSYTWWTKEQMFNAKKVNWFSANGWGGQKIIVLPEVETVIAFTGARYTSKVKEFGIVEDYILPAIK